ncbi:DISARM system phospholipase D-like protein DrmC [Alicyclobacillus hesperidum]|uniref:DISARM system phospholipase D-like protein DrmC n=1 Tax=Alicyclobacillus hesperidum TaxID=89784 RepID=UPI00058B559E|nr:DISARM system phospholipase D-like protein DrmC [Alicyclobacillus hesperidum]
MDELWRVVAELGLELHPDRIAAIADKIRSVNSVHDVARVRESFGPNVDPDWFQRLKNAWQQSPDTSPSELAAALRAAAATSLEVDQRCSVELVWTGPYTGMVPVRHTEQVLCEVIESAQRRLFLVSFVAYEVDSIIRALRGSARRGVQIDVLLESSSEHGGHVNIDSVKIIKGSISTANVYTWTTKSKQDGPNKPVGAVHAKCAVADGTIAFITSANLSQAAMEKNMELGVLLRGGTVPNKLERHLGYLVTTGIVERV